VPGVIPAPPETAEGPRWGLGDAVAAYLMAFFASTLILVAIVADPEDPTYVELLVANVPFWIFTIGFPLWATRAKGWGPKRDLGLAIRWTDVPLGAAVGVVAQLAIPLLYQVMPQDIRDRVGDEAEELYQSVDAHGSVLVTVLFVLTTVLVAPFAEELFYRGLVMRSIERRAGLWPAVAITALVFALIHFQAIQTLGLLLAGLVFGALAARTGRLGPAMVAHMAFNGLAVIQLMTS
jgi:membrane protease YdiL (CAAX protease family)